MPTDLSQTYKTAKMSNVALPISDACLVFSYPTGPQMGAHYAVKHSDAIIGRTEECQIRNNDGSVSRNHARVEFRDDGYHAVDLGSTKGTFVNNVFKREGRLEDGNYLRIGNCICRFFEGGNLEAEYHDHEEI